MSHYEDWVDAWEADRDVERRYHDACVEAATMFVDAFRTVVRPPSVEILPGTDDDDGIHDGKSWTVAGALALQPDGGYAFRLLVVLKRLSETRPRQAFAIPVSVRFRGPIVDYDVAGLEESFEWPIEEDDEKLAHYIARLSDDIGDDLRSRFERFLEGPSAPKPKSKIEFVRG